MTKIEKEIVKELRKAKEELITKELKHEAIIIATINEMIKELEREKKNERRTQYK